MTWFWARLLGLCRPVRKARPTRLQFTEMYEATGERLGRGAFGSVSTYRHRPTGREYAVKKIRCRSNKDRAKVLEEIEMHHVSAGCENVLRLLEHYEEDGTFFLVFDKMAGGDLFSLLSRRPMTRGEVRAAVAEVARALRALHATGVAHCDVKPDNVLCEVKGQVTPLRLCDLNLASRQANMTGFRGSPDLMAPEVIIYRKTDSSPASYDKSCDMWSLGAMLYMMLFDIMPFERTCGRKRCTFGQEFGKCHDCDERTFSAILNGDFMIPQNSSKASSSAVDLVKRLLIVNADKRLTAEEVCEHHFIREYVVDL